MSRQVRGAAFPQVYSRCLKSLTWSFVCNYCEADFDGKLHSLEFEGFIMKAHWMFFATLMTVVAADFYNSKYDSFDVQPLLDNDRILLSYTKCFLDQGPCTPDAKDFKKVIPEALETTCAKCSPKQKQLIKKVIKAVMEKHPDAWAELNQKFDKDKKFKDSFDKFLAEQD